MQNLGQEIFLSSGLVIPKCWVGGGEGGVVQTSSFPVVKLHEKKLWLYFKMANAR